MTTDARSVIDARPSVAGTIKTAIAGCRVEISSSGVIEIHEHGCPHIERSGQVGK